ncbi:MAG: ribosome maturation factor RimP [Oscillospiraceae bacterium]
MKNTKKPNTVAICTQLAQPVLLELGLTLWDVRYEKEGSSWFLRYFIEKEGGININDCECFSRKIDKILDTNDPVDQSYYLEVSSPGIERQLVKDWHFEQYIGSEINVKLIRPVEGVREFTGPLVSYKQGEVCMLIDEDVEMNFQKSEAASICLYVNFTELSKKIEQEDA